MSDDEKDAARQAFAQQLAARGWTAERIASLCGLSLPKVRRWLGASTEPPTASISPTTDARGFARLDPETRSEVSRLGGQTAHKVGRAHRFTSEEARAARVKSGEAKAAKKALRAAGKG